MDVEFPSPSASFHRPHPFHQKTPQRVPQYTSLPDSYRCMVCRGVLREAVQTKCGHRACAVCVDLQLTGNPQGGAMCPANEESCVILKDDEIQKDFSIRREIRKLKVYCDFREEGCSEILPWSELESHLSTCEYRPVRCQYAASGCQAVLARKQREEHVVLCDFRPAQCYYCTVTLIWITLKSHEETDCPEVIIPCPNSCGTDPLPRRQMNAHIENECPKRQIQCEYNPVGCKFSDQLAELPIGYWRSDISNPDENEGKGKEEEQVRHKEVSRDQHSYLTALYSRGVGQETARCTELVKDMNSTIQSLKDSMADQSNYMAVTIKALDELKRSLKEFRLKAVSQTERLIALERKVENLAGKDKVDQQRRDATILKEGQESLEKRVTLLERAGPTGGVGGATTVQSQSQQDRRFALVDAQCAEFDLRLQVIETANYHGVLMWKIRDYRRRKQDAQAGKTPSLYSQPFYTGRFGYKMCARVYLNGDGLGRGTHLSLFFVVQRGEYDALLPWPFRQKVTLMLLDQDTGTRHAVDSFRPDVTSSSFKRPETEMNVGSGSPLFISHVVLETPTYLRDDTIFIKVVVDIEGLKQH